MRVYLVNPKNPENMWTLQSSAEAVGSRTLMPNCALATLIALTPEDVDVEYVYCDENVTKIDFGTDCDLVAVTGYGLHAQRIREICDAFRRRGVPVALGGVFATLNREKGRELADHLFIGEAELVWPRFLRDWARNSALPQYEQESEVDIKASPPPDWSLVRGKDYLNFSVQTSRGCPNNCDFCDVVRLLGRKYRTKSIGQIMVEMENARAKGAQAVFFSDDNFFVNPSFTRELLTEIIRWNTSIPCHLSFAAQATIGIADDEDLLRLLADARFSMIFLGVESPRRECLEEINKGHLFRHNAKELVSRMSSYGILPLIGLIVGFDHDDEYTFDELEEFLHETASPIATISVLNAPENTALYHRMKEQGRLNEEFKGEWHLATNIVPKSMPLAELNARHRDLFKRLYDPDAFEERALRWLSNIKYFTPLYENSKTNYPKLFKLFYIMRFYVLHEPAPVRKLFFRMLRRTWEINPRLVKKAVTVMIHYCHFYDFVSKTPWQEARD